MPSNKHTRAFAAALAGGALLLTTACGGGGGRPSTSDLENAMSSGSESVFGSSLSDVPKDALHCIAEAMHDSKLSDAALRAVVDNDKDYEPSDTDKAAVGAMTGDMTKCVTSAAE